MTEVAGYQPLPQERLLLHELQHRINNEFAAAIGIASVIAARSRSGEVRTALSDVTELLHQYVDVNLALEVPEYDTVLDGAAYLRELCLSISRAKLNKRKIKLVFSAQSLPLRAERCWLLGMIVHELITNAARHAFEGGSGEICISIRRDGAYVTCGVQDNGSAASGIKPGRGLKIVHGLSNALGARFRQTFGPAGSRSLVVFPFDPALSEQECGAATICAPSLSLPPHNLFAEVDAPRAGCRTTATRLGRSEFRARDSAGSK